MPTSHKTISERTLSVLPIAFSGLALVLSFASFQMTAVRNVKPVLILSYQGDSGWHLKNVGNGPPLNVIVAETQKRGEWSVPVRVPPLAIGGDIGLRWLGHTNVKWLGASYADIDGRRYSSVTGEDLTTILQGNAFPRWKEQDIQKQWQVEETIR
jgi:hypothetical protein